MTTSTTTWTPPEPVVRQLSTKEGFTKAVVPASALMTALKVFLVLGLVLLAYNVVSTIQTLSKNDLPSSYWFDVFFSTEGERGGTDPMLVAMVWGPIIAIPIALVLLVLVRLTQGGRDEKAYSGFAQGGYVASALGLPVPFVVGRDQFVPQVIVPAHLGTPEVSRWFDSLTATVQGLDKPGSKQLTKALVKTLKKDDVAVPATTVFPDSPPFALLVRASNAVGAQTVRAVIPGGTETRAYVVDLKKVQGWG